MKYFSNQGKILFSFFSENNQSILFTQKISLFDTEMILKVLYLKFYSTFFKIYNLPKSKLSITATNAVTINNLGSVCLTNRRLSNSKNSPK